MNILIACDKFKGTLDAKEAAEAIERGLVNARLSAEVTIAPISDGGEGFTQAIVEAKSGELIHKVVIDALGRKVEAIWGMIPLEGGGKAAIIEMSQASGLWRISEDERDIMNASTYGTGQLIRDAIWHPKVLHVYIGIGGSATNDAGVGMAQALGIRFVGPESKVFPKDFASVTDVDVSRKIPLPEVTVACDVDNPLCGENGASAIFGPQKGATPQQVEELDKLLQHIAKVSGKEELANEPGAGAAGGLGFGLMAFADAKLVSGFDLVADALGLEDAIKKADIVITGEGGLDAQSLQGKGPIGVAELAKKHNKPCCAVAGKVDHDVDWSPYFKGILSMVDSDIPLEELMNQPKKHLSEMVRDFFAQLSI